MNANELSCKDLMIGDLVKIKDMKDPIKRISCIDEHLGIVDFWDDERSIVTSINNVLPIPLTAEILEEKGFEYMTDIVWHDIYVLKYKVKLANNELELDLDQTLMLAKDPYNVFYWIPEMSAVSALNFRYVHELQHLMKMLQIDKEVEV